VGPGEDGVPRARVYLQGGEVFATAEPTAVTTVLGSCVAVCLFAPGTGIGGVNHYLLPTSRDDRTGRFGVTAMRLLLERVQALGARRPELRAKVFGGGGTLGRRPGVRTLGEQNAELAVQTLAAEGIPILGGDVGGPRGRKLVFHVDTGDAWVLTL
jgi:chemotaxis protein CheD